MDNSTFSVWLYLKKHGVYFADEKQSSFLHSNDTEIDRANLKAYHWMDKQMTKKVGAAPIVNATPIWCWYIQDEHKTPKDVYYANQVCLELEISNNKILLSDFDLWHCVLMNGIAGPDDLDFDKLYDEIEKLPKNEKQRKIEDSWKSIFDIGEEDSWIQGCIWQLKYSDVVKIYHHKDNHRLKVFIPRKKKFK